MACQRPTDATIHIHLTQQQSLTQPICQDDSTIDGAAYLDDMIGVGVAVVNIASGAYDTSPSRSWA